MISIDANLLLFGFSTSSPFHAKALAFLTSVADDDRIAVSEFVLTEFSLHLRNPAVLEHPLSAKEAVEVIQSYRTHPRWRLLGFPPGSRDLHDTLWKNAAITQFARRRIYDTRTALSLCAFGVKEFATANVKDFRDLGFERVWNPLSE